MIDRNHNPFQFLLESEPVILMKNQEMSKSESEQRHLPKDLDIVKYTDQNDQLQSHSSGSKQLEQFLIEETQMNAILKKKNN